MHDLSRVLALLSILAATTPGVALDFESLGMMRRVPGTDVWYLSFRVRNDLRVPYRFELSRDDGTETVLDPLNPTVWEPGESALAASILERPPARREYEWVPKLYSAIERRPIRFFVAAGELETVVTPRNAGHYLVATNRHFRDVLTAAGYRLTYREFNGVHSELSWQDMLADGLVRLLGPGG